MSVPGRKARSVRGFAAAGAALALLGSMAAAGEDEVVYTPTNTALRELGRRLFFDPAASSRSGMRSCADCHLPEHGFSDPEKRSADDTALTQRHSQTLIDAGDSPTAHWDGEFASMNELVVGRLNVVFDPEGGAHYGSGTQQQGGTGRGFVSHRRNLRTGLRGFFEDVDALAPLQVDPRTSLAVVPAGLEPFFGSLDVELLLPNGVDTPGNDGPVLAFRIATGMPPARAAEFLFMDATFASGADPRAPSRADDFAPFVNRSLAASLPPATHALWGAARYREAFDAAFAHSVPSDKAIARAVAEYCHSIRSGESPYDRHVAGDGTALSASAKRGLELFTGEAGCVSCHVVEGWRAPFTDYLFHDTGIVWRSLPPPRSRLKVAQAGDTGRQARARTRKPGDLRAFKTPTLRDVSRRGPYMHDGSLATLEEVVRHYGSPPADPNLAGAFPKFAPTDEDVADLVAFLHSLTSDVRPGVATDAWTARVPRTRLRFVDANGRPLPGLRVGVEPAGDVLPTPDGTPSEARTLTTDPEGRLSFEPFTTTHARLVLPGGVRPVGGDLVPDTCASAEIEVPVAGTTRICVLDRSGLALPRTLVVRHPDAERFPGRRLPESRLRLVAVDGGRSGPVAALYEGPCRTDVGGTATLEWPLADRTSFVSSIDFVEGCVSIVTLP